MSVHRYRTSYPSLTDLQEVIESGLSISGQSGSWEIDVTLVNDTLLPDLDVVMAELGFSYVTTSPTTSRVSSESDALDFKGVASPGVSAGGDARLYFDSGSNRLMISQNGGAFFPVAGPGATATTVRSESALACPGTVNLYDAVYLTGADSVDRADSDDASKQPLIGIVLEKPTLTSAVIAYYGEVNGFAGLVAGATYYLGVNPGQITNLAPTTAGNIVQRIGFARNATTLVLMADRDWTEITT